MMKHSYSMVIAALSGDIEVFKWLRNNGMKWHPMTYPVAKQFFKIDIAEWALKNGCPKDAHSRGKISYTTAFCLELTDFDTVEETSQEGEEHEEDSVGGEED